MVSYQAPGVYMEEVPSGSRPIEGVGTSVAAFVGFTEQGPIGQAVRVTNWTQYQDTFGGFIRNGYTPLAVYGFFQNGGGNCFVVRVGGDAVSTDAQLALTARGGTQESLRFTSKLPGSAGNQISIEIADEASPEAEASSSTSEGEESEEDHSVEGCRLWGIGHGSSPRLCPLGPPLVLSGRRSLVLCLVRGMRDL